MNTGEIQISNTFLELLVDAGKKMKTTFTVYDPFSHHIVYGFNGEGFSCRECEIGALKYIEIDRTMYTDFNLLCRISVFTKDITAMLKMSNDMIKDTKCSVTSTKINLRYRKYLDRIDIRSINLIDENTNDVLLTIPTFRTTKFYQMYEVLTSNLNTIDHLDITNDDDMIRLLESKASEGAKHVRYKQINLFAPSNLFNINKGDRLVASHTNEECPRILVQVIKKKFIVNVIFKILNV